MRHLVSGKRLSRTASHRKAMLGNLATSILDKERVVTTISKAKEVRGVVERLISYAKQGDLHGIRLAQRTVHDKSVLNKLFKEIGPSYQGREGGYTRILKLEERKGDHALLSIIELVGRAPVPQHQAPTSRKGEGKTKSGPAAQESAAADTAEAAGKASEDAPVSGEDSAETVAESKPKRKTAKKAASAKEQPKAQEEKE